MIAIDPGTYESAYLMMVAGQIQCFDIIENDDLLCILDQLEKSAVVVESIESYGMPVGKDVFLTAEFIGEVKQVCKTIGHSFEKMPRRKVKMELCNSAAAKDGNVRQAIIDLYEPTGGGKMPQIGVKKDPGPLYGVTKHVWSALAIAIVWGEYHIYPEKLSHNEIT